LASGLSSTRLANKMGVDRQTLLNWESGEARISAKNLFKLSIIFNCDNSVFFDGLVASKETSEFR